MNWHSDMPMGYGVAHYYSELAMSSRINCELLQSTSLRAMQVQLGLAMFDQTSQLEYFIVHKAMRIIKYEVQK